MRSVGYGRPCFHPHSSKGQTEARPKLRYINKNRRYIQYISSETYNSILRCGRRRGVFCLTAPESRLLSQASCLTYPVSRLLSHVSWLTSPISLLLSHVSCLTSPVLRLLSQVSCLKSHVLCLTRFVSFQLVGGGFGRMVRSDAGGHGFKAGYIIFFTNLVRN